VSDNSKTIFAALFNMLAVVLIGVCVYSVWKNDR
jgi:hypothetical protein